MTGPRGVMDASALLAWLFQEGGEELVDRLRAFRHHGIHVLGSFTLISTVAVNENGAFFLILTRSSGGTSTRTGVMPA